MRSGVLRILRTGAQWQDLPHGYPPYQTCHRRFQQWQRDGRFEVILQALARDLVERGSIWSERRLHRRLLQRGQKGGSGAGKTTRGKGAKIMAITPPWCSCLRARASASPHETRLVEATFQQTFTPHGPEKLIGDRAYDSAPLDQRLQSKWGVELIAPHKTNRSKPPTPGRMKHNRTA